MQGTITGKDVFVHAPTVLRLFGVSAFLACAWAVVTRRDSTFLGVLHPYLAVDPARPGQPATSGRRAFP